MQATRSCNVRAARSAPAVPRRRLVVRAAKTTTSSKTIATNAEGTRGPGNTPLQPKRGDKPGFRWDGTMMRWVRDDRFAQMDNTVIQTKTGSNYTVWPVVHQQLVNYGLKSVTPQEAQKMQSQGWTLVDVRIEGDYEKNHAKGAICVPLFRFVQGTSFWDNVKKVTMASFAMQATERDPDYVSTMLSKVKKNQKVILMCAIGGTLTTGVNLRPDKYPNGIEDPDRSFGRESRCLKAAYELMSKGGWTGSNLVFVEGGFQQWRFQNLPTEKRA